MNIPLMRNCLLLKDLNDQSSDEEVIQPGRDLTDDFTVTQQDDNSNPSLEP